MGQDPIPGEADATERADRPWSYDRAVTRGFFHGERPAATPILDRRSVIYVAGGITVIAVGSLAYREPFAVRLLVVAAMVVAMFFLVAGLLRIYIRSLVHAHRGVVDRPELGDVRRWMTFALPLVVWPLLGLAAVLGGIALVQAFAR